MKASVLSVMRSIFLAAILLTTAFQSHSQCESNEVLFVVATAMWGNEVSWELVDENGVVVAVGADYDSDMAYTGILCLDDGCYVLNMFDSFGDGWNGAIITFLSGEEVLGTGTLSEGSEGSFGFGVNTPDCDFGQIMPGCMIEGACNYDPDANFDDGSCTFPGCTDPGALNYDDTAGCDDDSCIYPEPCELTEVLITMYDSFGDNWNGDAYVITNSDGVVVAEGAHEGGEMSIDALCLDDGCYVITTGGGSFDSENYWELSIDGEIIAEGGSPGMVGFGVNTDCEIVEGCTDADACNYNPDAWIEDGSCTYPGCIDPDALNYDNTAGCDDGSCEYPEPCEDNMVVLNLYDSFGDGWNGGYYVVTDSDNNVVAEGTMETGSMETTTICLVDGCYLMTVEAGQWPVEVSWEILFNDELLAEGGAPDQAGFGINSECDFGEGCTDNTACNYDDSATIDDGSCTYPGCNDPEALNYDDEAGCDDGSCEYPEPCDLTSVMIMMYDSFGDSWNGATYVITDDDGIVVAEGAHEGGSFSFDFACLADGCYTISTGGGAFDSENYWEVIVDGVIVSEGGSPSIDGFGINADDCEYAFGCTDELACNYDVDATTDDGSCTYPGCTDPNALNYDPYAGCDDGTCELCEGGIVSTLYVCTWDNGDEVELEIVDSEGNVVIYVDDLQPVQVTYFDICLYPGECYTVNMYNNVSDSWYDGYYWINVEGVQVSTGMLEDGETFGQEFFDIDGESCPVYGCTDPEALNYDPEANEDDGSCEYPEPCDYNTVMLNMYDSYGDGWNGGYYSIVNGDGVNVAEGTLDTGSEGTDVLCLADGCYIIIVEPGNWPDEVSWEVVHNGDVLAIGGAPGVATFGINADCEPIEGCTDATACNYNPDAWIEDGSCTYPGCNDPNALNYDEEAGCDDGSCEYPEPCDFTEVLITMYDSFGDNWNGDAYVITNSDGDVVAEGAHEGGEVSTNALCLDDGCYVITTGGGAFDSENYWELSIDGEIIAEGGSPSIATFGVNTDCEPIEGCTDATACNYNPDAWIEDGSCTYPGCTDPDALNYDEEAGCEDDSCEYPEPCDFNSVMLNMYDSFGDGWNGGYYSISNTDGVVVAEGTMETGSEETHEFCLEDGCYVIVVEAGTWPEEVSWEVAFDGNILASGGAPGVATFGINADCAPVEGCTDATACNYNPDAWIEDGTCTYPGCNDPDALNYDDEAGCDDGSCEYPQPCDLTSVLITMYDSFGDSWNGDAYVITNSDGDVVAEGAHEGGEVSSNALCLDDGCYVITTGGGSFDSENYWELSIDGEIIAEGGSPSIATFGVNTDCEPVEGCTDATACNYNPDAWIEDGSCTYPGCNDPDALNYDDEAGCDDGSCEYPEPCDYNSVLLNMYDSFGDGWNGGYYVLADDEGNVVAEGTMETGSMETVALCLADGCYTMYVEEGGWPEEVSWEFVYDGEVIAEGGAATTVLFGLNSDDCQIYGCTDPDALNYNPEATADDGSCEYPEPCEANAVQLYLSSGFYAWEMSFELTDSEGNVILADGDFDNYSTMEYELCLDDGCYFFNMFDSYGDGWNGGWYFFTGDDGLIAEGSLFFGGDSFDIISINGDCEIDGCTDEDALNYNPVATIDDGSCFYIDDFQVEEVSLMVAPNMAITLAPNPVTIDYKIQLTHVNTEKDLSITIHDLSGRLIYQDIEATYAPSMTIEMNASELESGMYILTVVNGDDTSSVTFVRQN